MVRGVWQEWAVAQTLVRRELLKLVSERARVFGLVAQPLLLWIVLGFGFDSGFGALASSGLSPQSFRAYFFPGVVVMTILFGSVFSSMTIIEDRSNGFLQSALLAPARDFSVVLGKTIGVMCVTFTQVAGILFVGTIALSDEMGVQSFPLLLGWGLLSCFSLIPINLAIALALNSTQAFHAFMGVALFPLWALSGSIFPMQGEILGIVAIMNPLTYMVEGFRVLMGLSSGDQVVPMEVGAGSLLLIGCAGILVTQSVIRKGVYGS